MKYDYEVGFKDDDTNDIRLPGSCNPEPMRGDSAYGPGRWNMAKPTPLDVADTGGVVGMPSMNNGFGMEGSMSPSTNSNVSVSGPHGEVQVSTSTSGYSSKRKSKDTI